MPLRTIARRTYRQFREDDVLTYAASLAYHGVLSLFPFLVFLLALVTFFDLPQLMQHLLNWSSTVLPDQSMQQITEVVRNFEQTRHAGLLSLGAAGAVWAASGGVRSAMTVLNQAYEVAESRVAWKRYLLSIVYTLGLTLLILTATGLMLMGPRAAAWVAQQIGMADVVVRWWTWVRYAVAIAVLILATGVAYSLLPNIEGFRWFTPGAALAVLLWIGLSLGFRAYIESFGRFNLLYGSVGAVIVLLLYFWLSSIAFLLGGELNSVIDRSGAERGGRGRAIGGAEVGHPRRSGTRIALERVRARGPT